MNRKQYHLNSSGKKPILFSPLLGLLSCNIDGVESCHLFQQANIMDQQKLPQSLLYSYQGCKTFYSSVDKLISPYLPSHGLIKISFCNSSLPDPKSYFSTVNQLLLNNDYQSFMTSKNIAILRKHQGYNQG